MDSYRITKNILTRDEMHFYVHADDKNGMKIEFINRYLSGCGWFIDFSRHVFQYNPDEFIPVLVDEMIRSGVAGWKYNILMASAPYNIPDTTWMHKNIKPKDW